MPKQSEFQRAMAQIDQQIANLQAAKAALIAAHDSMPKRTRKPVAVASQKAAS
jgi:hypothetical protein